MAAGLRCYAAALLIAPSRQRDQDAPEVVLNGDVNNTMAEF